MTLDDIRAARGLLDGIALRTPTFSSRTFSELTGTTVHLKAENLQKTGSFKIRGATNRLAQLDEVERRRGVVTSSAGNHAQGVALAARALGVPATVYMPVDAPLAKQAATRAYGAEVVLEGASFDDAQAAALAAAGGRPFIPAFDDELIVAGQGTVALELLEDVPEVDLLLVPLGGGGLLAGVATAVRALRPQCRIVGVQASGCAPYWRSFRDGGGPSPVTEAQTIADGIAVKRPGAITYPIIEALVDDVVTVTDEEICSAIVLLLERAKLLVEGAGAVGLAALLSGRVPTRGHTAVLLSGGNLDAGLLQAVVRYGMTVSGRYLVLRTKILDRPGSLLKLLDLLAQDRINLIEVEHHREGMDVGVVLTEVELTIETRDEPHCQEVLATLGRWGYEAERVR